MGVTWRQDRYSRMPPTCDPLVYRMPVQRPRAWLFLFCDSGGEVVYKSGTKLLITKVNHKTHEVWAEEVCCLTIPTKECLATSHRSR